MSCCVRFLQFDSSQYQVPKPSIEFMETFVLVIMCALWSDVVGCGGGGGDGGNAIANRKCFADSTTQFFSFILSSFFFCENRWNTRVLSNGKHSKLKRLQTMAEQFIHIYYRRMKFRIFLHLTVVSRQPNHYTYVQSRWTIAKKEGSLKSLTSLRTHTLAHI